MPRLTPLATIVRCSLVIILCLFSATLLAQAQADPMNRTGGSGEDPLSRNFNWTVPLSNLSGRAGLDVGLSLSYNSLATWRKSGTQISFDDDGGSPAPGFRLGFPVIQPAYFSTETGKQTYLLISPDGSRTELRQVGSTALYEAADSSYLLLDSASMTLKTTDGTQLSFALLGSDYHCTKIKDRNGNFITMNYVSGRIDTVVDTLARTIKFNYDAGGFLTSISQVWTVNGAPATRYWARFTYSNLTISTNFTGLTNLGPQNGAIIKVLTRVTLIDDSRFDFDYTTWGQVWKIRNYAADGHLLNYRSYNLPLNNSTAQTDCPRFTQRRDWAENWNRSGPAGAALLPAGAEQEVVTTYTVPTSTSWTLPDGTPQTGMRAQVTSPDGTYNKIYFPGSAGASGWHRGLASMVETYDSGNTRQRQSVTTWTQDNTGVAYPLNPRVTETNVYDPAGNRARTRVTYQSASLPDGTSCKLPQDVFEYQANATTVLRRTRTDYNLTSTYTTRRIIGLVSDRTLYGVDPVTQVETLMSKVGFLYDETGSIYGNDLPVQHDNTGYTSAFVAGRANLSSVKRYDVTNTTLFVTSRWKYNTAGGVVASIDPLNHQTSVNYADWFSDGNNSRNTHAYPTTVTDADGFASAAQYNFDFGAVTRTQGPPPAGHSTGAIKHFTYDSMSRIQKVAIEFNGDTDYSYVRFTYPAAQNRIDTYATIQDGLGESHSFKVSDGHGRLIASANDHPGSVGGFSGQLTLFDTMGRAVKTSNPTETNASGSHLQWVAAGDDASASWRYTQQTYDWKGRPLVTTNTDTTTKTASYGGCGCAGGEVVTITDEGTLSGGVAKKRQQKIYADVLGRTVKTEVLNWNGAGAFGTGGTVYSAVVNVYNSRDQVTSVKQYAGAATGDGSCPTNTCQQATMTYDGHGRLKTRHVPEQQVDTNNSYSTDHTTWNYNTDDTVQKITDARGASQTFSYNARHLVSGVIYAAPSVSPSIPVPGPTAFAYDNAGNRQWMTDDSGRVDYLYDNLSRMQSEARQFSGLSGTFTLSYEYGVSGAVKKVTDQTAGTSVTTTLDRAGRMSAVSTIGYGGAPTQYVSQMKYRAFGAIKSVTFGNSTNLNLGYNSRGGVSSFQLTGATYSGTTPVPIASAYQYYADGEIKFAQDQGSINSIKDRAYQYDNASRLKEAYSGTQARDYVNGTNVGTTDGPYRQTSTYDAWDNVLSGGGRFWSRNVVETASYNQFNRNPNWTYDAEGNLISRNESFGDTGSPSHGYDAAGRNISVGQVRPCWLEPQHLYQLHFYTNTQTFDGDGRVTRYEQAHKIGPTTHAEGSPIKTYYLRSSVLRGRVISEYDGSDVQPAWTQTYVYASGERIGTLSRSGASSARSTWRVNDPVTGDEIFTLDAGLFGAQTTLDPNGVEVGFEDPFPPPGEEDETCVNYDPNYVDPLSAAPFLNPFEGGANCIIDGIEEACGSVGSQAMVQCPDNSCGGYAPGANRGLGGFVKFRAYSDGYANYLPDGTRYVGDGLILNFLWTGGGREKLSFNEVEYGPLAQGLASSFTSQGSYKRNRNRRRPPSTELPQRPKYPPVTAADINVITFPDDPFSQVQSDIVDAIVDIANRQACSDAFKKHHLKIPYDVVKSGNLKIAGVMALYRPNASELLGWSPDLINNAAYQFRKQNRFLWWKQYTAEMVWVGIPTVVYNATAVHMSEFGGLREVVTHSFIHLGGKVGDLNANPHDLGGDFEQAYKEIINACRENK